MCWLMMTPATVTEDEDDDEEDNERRHHHREQPHVQIDVHQVGNSKPHQEYCRNHQNLQDVEHINSGET